MTALDDFKLFVKDAEAGAQYAKWAHDNPGELARWHGFRDAILAGDAPLPPVMLTPHGRELIDAGVLTEHYQQTTSSGAVTRVGGLPLLLNGPIE